MGRIIGWNKRMVDLTGISAEETCLMSDEQLRDPGTMRKLSRLPSLKTKQEKWNPTIYFPEDARRHLGVWIQACLSNDVEILAQQFPLRTNLWKASTNEDGETEGTFVEVCVEAIRSDRKDIVGAVVLVKGIFDCNIFRDYVPDMKSQKSMVEELSTEISTPVLLIGSDLRLLSWNVAFSVLSGFTFFDMQALCLRDLFLCSTDAEFLLLGNMVKTAVEDEDAVIKPLELQLCHEKIFIKTKGHDKVHVALDAQTPEQNEMKQAEVLEAGLTVITIVERYKQGQLLVHINLRDFADQQDYVRNMFKFRVRELLRKGIDSSIWVNDALELQGDNTDNLDHIKKIDEKIRSRLNLNNLVWRFALSNSGQLVYFIFLVNLLHQANLLAMLPVVVILTYGLIEFPRASTQFWKLLNAYVMVVMLAKFVYQFPLFCTLNSGQYSLSPNGQCFPDNYYSPSVEARPDYLVGLYKKGPLTFRQYFILDIACIFTLLFHCYKLTRNGYWSVGGREIDDPESSFQQRMSKFFSDESEVKAFAPFPHPQLLKINEILKIKGPNPVQRYLFSLCPLDCGDKRIRDYKLKPGRDYYTLIFGFQLVALFSTLFLWNYLANAGDNVAAAISTSRFPGEMVTFFFMQLLILIIDRVFYHYRSYHGKLLLQYASVIYVHHYLFIKLPEEGSQDFSANVSLVIFYLIWVCYFYWSAMQLRYGYPSFQRSFFTKDSSSVRASMYQGFLASPFLNELRTIISWMTTPSTLGLTDTFVMEDIHAKLFQIKVELEGEKKSVRGSEQPFSNRCLYGSVLVVLLVVVVFGPLFLFSSANPAQTLNNVTGVSLSLSFVIPSGAYPFLSTTNIQSMQSASDADLVQLKTSCGVPETTSLNTVQVITLDPFADTFWTISSSALFTLRKGLNNSNSYIRYSLTFVRPGPSNLKQVVDSNAVTGTTPMILERLTEMVDQMRYFYEYTAVNVSCSSVELPNTKIPRVFRLTSTGFQVLSTNVKSSFKLLFSLLKLLL
eukprot:TRINITY_DN7345_c0_g1_i5.p1 TRINITY_DN7345_c0_g1~~TRINITY_DN7345_c0_g1_i5.p1  ORF type:complete len:1149 (+),score=236.86 TRINITY_DN7345_c0_g1_i5:424-3447(+)